MNIKVLCTQPTCTYVLGKSLYIPLTSRSNCYTLPETRGPGFKLPRSVVASLVRVRDYEIRNDQIIHGGLLANDGISPGKEGGKDDDHTVLNQTISNSQQDQEEKIALPKYKYSRVPSWPLFNHDEQLYPTAEMILSEVQNYVQGSDPPKSIVFAGEGEPTLRLQTLMKLSENIKYRMIKSLDDCDCSIRIVTNGIVLANLNHGSRRGILEQLKSKGVDGLSIALMTSCPREYIDLMQPNVCSVEAENLNDANSHEKLCELIQDAAQMGFHVECTGVDRSFVDKQMAEMLANELGAYSFRWRPYFP